MGGYEFHLRFSVRKGSYETSYMLTLNISVLFCLAHQHLKCNNEITISSHLRSISTKPLLHDDLNVVRF